MAGIWWVYGGYKAAAEFALCLERAVQNLGRSRQRLGWVGMGLPLHSCRTGKCKPLLLAKSQSFFNSFTGSGLRWKNVTLAYSTRTR